MALNEPILPPNTPLVVGRPYMVDRTHAVIRNSLTGTIATLSASLPGSPSIRQCDTASRLGGVYLSPGQGGIGLDIFDV